MRKPFVWPDIICTRSGHGRIFITGKPGTAHPRSQVDNDIDITLPNKLNRLSKKPDITGSLTGLRISYMNVNYGSTGLRRRYCSLSNTLWRYRYAGVLADGIPGTGHGTGNNDVMIHTRAFLERTLSATLP
jgi:hypothetical protein